MRHAFLTVTIAVFLTWGLASTATAQVPPTSRVALGLGFGNYGVFHGIYSEYPSLNPTVTFAVTPRHGLELAGAFMLAEQPVGRRRGFTYSILYRYTFRGEGRVRAFVTAGGTGLSLHESYDATAFYPAYSQTEFYAPVLPTAGAGVTVAVSRRVLLRGDAAILIGADPWVTPRFSVGIVVPIGR